MGIWGGGAIMESSRIGWPYRSRHGYTCIRDGLVLEGEVQEMNNKENFYDEGPYKAHVRGFFLAYHQVLAYPWWLLFYLTEFNSIITSSR